MHPDLPGKSETVPTNAYTDELLDELFQKTSVLGVPSTRERPRRTYRLILKNTQPLRLQLRFPNGDSFQSMAHDLSAGGFSCACPHPVTLNPQDRLRVTMHLPMDEGIRVETTAVFINSLTAGSLNSEIYRFQFGEEFTECERNHIHRFILKTQMGMMRERTREMNF